jgi:hypothetical protein
MSHYCEESKTCTCSMLADEPNETCPAHGAGSWPPRCGICGRFMSWKEIAFQREFGTNRHVYGQQETV